MQGERRRVEKLTWSSSFQRARAATSSCGCTYAGPQHILQLGYERDIGEECNPLGLKVARSVGQIGFLVSRLTDKILEIHNPAVFNHCLLESASDNVGERVMGVVCSP